MPIGYWVRQHARASPLACGRGRGGWDWAGARRMRPIPVGAMLAAAWALAFGHSCDRDGVAPGRTRLLSLVGWMDSYFSSPRLGPGRRAVGPGLRRELGLLGRYQQRSLTMNATGFCRCYLKREDLCQESSSITTTGNRRQISFIQPAGQAL